MQPLSQLKDEETESEQPREKKKQQQKTVEKKKNNKKRLGIAPRRIASIRLLGFLKWKYFTLAELATKLHTV